MAKANTETNKQEQQIHKATAKIDPKINGLGAKKALKIRHFSGLKEFTADGFKRINLFVGLNNYGKTSILEALYLACNYQDPVSLNNLNTLRGLTLTEPNIDEIINNLFYSIDVKQPIEIDITCENGTERFSIELIDSESQIQPKTANSAKLPLNQAQRQQQFCQNQIITKYRNSLNNKTLEATLELISVPLSNQVMPNKVANMNAANFTFNYERNTQMPFPVVFIHSNYLTSPSDSQKYIRLIELREDKEIIAILKFIEPRLKEIKIIGNGNQPELAADFSDDVKLLPLNTCGKGLLKVFSYLLSICSAKNGVVLIDEIENGLHYSIHELIWEKLDYLAQKYNVQIFATTHSQEMIEAAYRAFKDSNFNNFSYYRIDRKLDKTECTNYDATTFRTAIENNFEIR